MGVHGLWELLAPVGRRVSVNTLAGKRLAVDASIWMVQFLKAMRDEKGEMVRNAHLLGFFRRICKLLFLRTKPVFVFDGGTPALKRRTVIARRRQRENAQAKVRKTAEKLLLNHLKALKLMELANDIKNQKLKHKNNTNGQKDSDLVDLADNRLGRSNVKEIDEMSAAEFAAKEDRNLSQTIISRSCRLGELDEMLAASIAAEDDGILARKHVASTSVNPSEEDCDADEEMILSTVNAEVDMAVLAALPQSIQLDILAQLKGKKSKVPMMDVDNEIQEVIDRDKGKGILLSQNDIVQCSSRSDNMTSSSYDQDKIDGMLAASIAAEESTKLVNNASTSLGASTIQEEDDNSDEDEEMILPAMHGEVDPAVLASLPPSMQLDLLVQMRERLMAENRQKYQKVKKDPSKFSELQIQAYLKTVAFRREIDEVQKAAAGRGVGGVQTSRIASEANREYIFSSSFTGDKLQLTSARSERNKDTQQNASGTIPSQNFVNSITSGNDSNTSCALVCNEPSGPFDESIQTNLDERGQYQVSRLRAMGMHMTRDIQRNLDLMKEIEQDRTDVNKNKDIDTVINDEKNGPSEGSRNQLVGKSHQMNADLVGENLQNEHSMLDRDTSIEISFEYDGKNKFVDGEDDIFANLVAGNAGANFFIDITSEKEKPSNSDSDCDWQEGIVEVKSTNFDGDNKVELNPSVAKENISDESEVEWEAGECEGAKRTSSFPTVSGKETSRGRLEEEADLQEAIKRSLENVSEGEPRFVASLDEHSNADKIKSDHGSHHADSLDCCRPMDLNDNVGFLSGENSIGSSTLLGNDGTEQNELYEIVDRDEKLDYVAKNILQTSYRPGSRSKSCVASSSSNMEVLIEKPCMMDSNSHFEYSNLTMKDEVHLVAEHFSDECNDNGKSSIHCNYSSKANSLCPIEKVEKNYDSESLRNSTDMTEPAIPFTESSLRGSTEVQDTRPEFLAEDNDGICCKDGKSSLANDAFNTPGDSAQVAEDSVEQQMRILGQEYISLENDQRKLERNAESVNSELFTECQELLQMFGLPYIIAPMEAEAQCAYLELAKLVDGVVTDDSDVLLFGARNVYKNIFDERKYVETYFMEDIEKELGLTREKLIHMALLLGSDYTEGVSGIGIVNAIEVVNAFPEEDGLLKFRQWVESPDLTILGRLDAKCGSYTRNKGSKVDKSLKSSMRNIKDASPDPNIYNAEEHKESLDCIQEIRQTFMDKHRNISKNWHIPSSFPSETVISAYFSPQVDKSTEPFMWGKPDHLVLRKLCWEKFGWTSQKADELLLPVLKEYNRHETQLRLEAFYTFNERFAKIRSKRIKKAVKGITHNQPSDLIDDTLKDSSVSTKNGGGNPVEPGHNKMEISKATDKSVPGMKKSKMKLPRKRKSSEDTVAMAWSCKKQTTYDHSSAAGRSGVENLQTCMQTGEEKFHGRVNRSGRGRGKARGRGRGRGVDVNRGREEKSPSFESCETTSSDTDDQESRVHVGKSKVPQELRRSMRSRKPVKYSFKDHEVEDADDSSDQSNQTCLPDEAPEKNLSCIRVACGDATTDFSGGKERSTVNICPEKDFPRDYLESEGYFCKDASGTSQPRADNLGDSFGADSSDDYLKMGGGFCLDNSEAGDNHNAIDDNPATTKDIADTPNCSNILDEDNRDKFSSDVFIGNEAEDRDMACKFIVEPNDDHLNALDSRDDHSDLGFLMPDDACDNKGTYKGRLSAMPFLRKKRKNN